MFVKIRKNKRTQRRSVLICHNVRFHNKIRQITVKTIGHSADTLILSAWMEDAKIWIKENGANWFKCSFPKKRQIIMKQEVSIFNVREESFRINKHNLQMRPIYHFTPKRIQAHILLCYMVFTLMRHVQFKLQKLNHQMSVDRIIDAVRDVQASILVDERNNNRYRMLSSLSEDAEKIYKVFNIERELTTMPLGP